MPTHRAQGTTAKANPDSAQLPVRQRALEDGKTVYMAIPRLAERAPFFALDPDHLDQPPARRRPSAVRPGPRGASCWRSWRRSAWS